MGYLLCYDKLTSGGDLCQLRPVGRIFRQVIHRSLSRMPATLPVASGVTHAILPSFHRRQSCAIAPTASSTNAVATDLKRSLPCVPSKCQDAQCSASVWCARSAHQREHRPHSVALPAYQYPEGNARWKDRSTVPQAVLPACSQNAYWSDLAFRPAIVINF